MEDYLLGRRFDDFLTSLASLPAMRPDAKCKFEGGAISGMTLSNWNEEADGGVQPSVYGGNQFLNPPHSSLCALQRMR